MNEARFYCWRCFISCNAGNLYQFLLRPPKLLPGAAAPKLALPPPPLLPGVTPDRSMLSNAVAVLGIPGAPPPPPPPPLLPIFMLPPLPLLVRPNRSTELPPVLLLLRPNPCCRCCIMPTLLPKPCCCCPKPTLPKVAFPPPPPQLALP